MIEIEKKRKFSLKLKIFVLLAVLVPSAFSFGYFAKAVTSTSVPVYPQDLPSTDSFVVKTDGSGNYWAVKSDGSIPYSGTNAIYVIQSSLTTAATSRGTVELSAGFFYVDYHIDVPSYVTFKGQGLTQTNLVATTTMSYVVGMMSGAWQKLKDMNIDGNAKADYCVRLDRGEQSFVGIDIENVYAVRAITAGFLFDHTDTVTWTNCYTSDTKYGLINYASASGGHWAIRCSFIGTTHGIYLSDNVDLDMYGTSFSSLVMADNVRVQAIACHGETWYDTADFIGSWVTIPNRLNIQGGWYRSAGGGGNIVGAIGNLTIGGNVYFDTNQTYNIAFTGNLIIDEATKQNLDKGINYDNIKLYENSGSTSVSNGETINHGLVGAPTSVIVTSHYFLTLVSVTEITATDFTVQIWDVYTNSTYVGPIVIYWDAKCNP